jgi:hypothetical protein
VSLSDIGFFHLSFLTSYFVHVVAHAHFGRLRSDSDH